MNERSYPRQAIRNQVGAREKERYRAAHARARPSSLARERVREGGNSPASQPWRKKKNSERERERTRQTPCKKRAGLNSPLKPGRRKERERECILVAVLLLYDI